MKYVLAFAALLLIVQSAAAQVASPPRVGDDGSTRVPAYVLPFSDYASPEAKRMFVENARNSAAPATDLAARIKAEDAINEKRVARMRALYPVSTTARVIGGVQTDLVEPVGGVAPGNRHRVLINLHGGGFLWGARSGGLVESIPIASVGRIRVVTVDYRMAPTHRFPAASEDVAAVYRALLKEYPAKSIGVYGCSAGAVLTGETIAWLDKEKLPLPGAIGMFCSGIVDVSGDSVYRTAAEGAAPLTPGYRLVLPYFQGADMASPLIFPGNSQSLLRRFPPTLLISGSRDGAEGAVLQSHRLLRRAGVAVELNVWDGMWHSFMSDPDLPESREVYAVVTAFFDRKLLR